MLQLKWNKTHITTNTQANDMLSLFDSTKPTIGAFDTETNGLHIILSKMFLFQFGWIDPDQKTGHAYVVDLQKQPELSRQVIKAWNKRAKTLKKYLAHNVKFDMHMLKNSDLEYCGDNLSDSMFYIRYAHDALTPANGGPPMGLKDYCAQFIYAEAKQFEKIIKAERTKIAKEYNVKLKTMLKNCGAPPEKYGAKSYTMGVINKMFSDPLLEPKDLDIDVQRKYADWYTQLPYIIQKQVTSKVESNHIPYHYLNRENMIKYALDDIVDVLEVYFKLAPIVYNRGNDNAIKFEEDCIIPLYEMERVGFCVDVPYIKNCRTEMKDYIKLCRETLHYQLGEEVTIGQHARIKLLLRDKFSIDLQSTGKEYLDRVLNTSTNEAAKGAIRLIQEIRTLEKWYSTYILRFLQSLKETDRLYTTINQVGTVSGRVTSDFQQFPKNGITTSDGAELFHPRKMVKPTGGDYPAIVYLDYRLVQFKPRELLGSLNEITSSRAS